MSLKGQSDKFNNKKVCFLNTEFLLRIEVFIQDSRTTKGRNPWKDSKTRKKCGEAGDRTADLRITTILWNQNSGALAHSATKDLMLKIGFLMIYRKVVPLLLCQHWFIPWTTVFFNFDRLLLKDKTTLPNCFGMNGHQKTLSFSNRKPIKGQKGQNVASIYL